MNYVEISHNPFIVETKFLIDGCPLAEGCKLSSYRESRLQVWVETLFDELSLLFNGDNCFKLNFKGVESDYLDVLAAAERARDLGMKVELNWIKVDSAESRLNEIKKLMDEARSNPKFESYFQENEEMIRAFEEAFNRDFDVFVVATMSAGKSTLINAMLGRDLLPAANEATTATIARITDNDSLSERFIARRVNNQGQVVEVDEDVVANTLKAWNRLPDTKIIDLEGNIKAIQERENVRLVLTDTPGPNNSQNEDHRRITMSFIQDSVRNPLILYVLNATQLGVNDDKNLLGMIAEIMKKGGKQSKDRFIFVVNKMDAFDPEIEEIPAVLGRVCKYLEVNGIENPIVYPVSAYLTKLLRKPSDLCTTMEQRNCESLSTLFREQQSLNLVQYMSITSRVKRSLEDKRLSPLMQASGLPAVEAMIDEYIDKYNFPHRVKRAYDALCKAITVGLHEADLNNQLEVDERELMIINQEVDALKERKKKGFDADAYKNELQADGKLISRSVENELAKLESENESEFRRVAGTMKGEVGRRDAESKVGAVEERLKFHFDKLINEYEMLFQKSQDDISHGLAEEYQRYVVELFKDCDALDLPIFEGVRKTVADISLNVSLCDKDIKERRVKTGSYEVSVSTWYKPWTWGKTETHYTYKDEEYVNLNDFWAERATSLSKEFGELVKAARNRVYEGKDQLIDAYLNFFDVVFDQKFAELLNDLQQKLNDRDARVEAVTESKKMLEWISEFKGRLDCTLAV